MQSATGMKTLKARPSRATTESRRPGFVGSLLLNTLALGGLWLFYSTVRQLTADSFALARDNADRLIAFQESVGLPSEAVFQGWFLDYEWFVRAANVFYIGMHFPTMIGFLLWMLIVKREAMPRVRWALVGSTMAGLVIHLAFPLAPPRMLRPFGFVDTARLIGPDPYALGIAKTANELAAMPSMHVGWALLVALAVIRLTTSRLRWLVLAHPIITSFVVVITANHFWTDVIVGASLTAVAWWLAGLVRPTPGADRAFEFVELDESDMADADIPGEAYELDGAEN